MGFIVDINTRETTTLENALQAINFFSEIKLNLKYDALASTFQFSYLFDASKFTHLEVAGITHYHEAIIYYQPADINGQAQPKKKILTGLVLSQNFIDSPIPELLSIGGYSKPGLMDDCDIPVDIPLQSDGLQLSKIISRIAAAFRLDFKVETPLANGIVLPTEQKTEKERADGTIPKTTSKTSENAASYIKKLCLQKNIVLTHNEDGAIVVKTANTEGLPVLVLDADENPQQGYQRMNLNTDGASMFRFYTIVRQADDEGGNESSFTLKNPLSPVAAVPRYKVEVQTSGSDVTVGEAARNALSKSLKSIVLTINIVSETASTTLILPDNTIHVKNKKLNMFKMVKYFIESVEVTQTPESTTQVLTCVLPWVYNYYSKGLDNTNPAGPYNVFIEHGKNAPGQ